MPQANPVPVPNRLESFWLTERDETLRAARTTCRLPHEADAVIIGSGLTGAMLAYNLFEQSRTSGNKMNIVMLEADECCGGATARNGGHCKPITYLGYRDQSEKHGKETANHLIEFEEAALEEYAGIVARESIDCDLVITRAFDLYMDEEDACRARVDLEARCQDNPARLACTNPLAINDPKELERVSGVKGARWGAHYPAGHLWPYKLATSLIGKAITKGLNLQTFTPVSGIKRSGSDWMVHSPRGSIKTRAVVVATNAYTASVLPEFLDNIVPIRGAACSIRPAASHSLGGTPGPLRYTYGIRFGKGDFDYLIPRQGRGIPGRGDKSVILGGAKSMFLKTIPDWYDNVKDDQEMPGARKYFEEYMTKYFAGWDGDAGNVEKVWSGVLGYSSDLMPYVGEHPDKPKLFVCAGFTGHGMPRIPGCTRELAASVLSCLGEGDQETARQRFETAIPRPYQLTKERLLSRRNVIIESMGQNRQESMGEPIETVKG